MPITYLSEEASRTICSTLTLNDATSVAKELIDNALDARASNITIEIAANTLDVIQVKDNGFGIGIEDRQLLCKRGYTSKIRTLEDLVRLGGKSLGFRGEALASIAELSESTTITTRVDGEVVATLLKINQRGKLISSSSASHGTGTTVRIEGFLQSIPVRRQASLKNFTKILAALKKLLYDYAFARPTVRFLLKVLKSKNEKLNWSYVPVRDLSDLISTSAKIVGKDVAAQCIQQHTSLDSDEYAVDALILNKASDHMKVQGTAQFVSIDGRPLTTERGFIREVTKQYRLYLQNAMPEGSKVPNKPFCCLRFTCPPESYDVNIEPTKDEVLFQDPQKLLTLTENLFKECYGGLKENPIVTKTQHSSSRATDSHTFDLLLTQKNPSSNDDCVMPSGSGTPQRFQPDTNLSAPTTEPFSTKGSEEARLTPTLASREQDVRHDAKASIRQTICPHDENVACGSKQEGMASIERPDTVLNADANAMDPHVTNPFTLAKINTRVRPITASNDSNVTAPKVRQSFQCGPHRRLPNVSSFVTFEATQRTKLLDIRRPYQNPGPPVRPFRPHVDTIDNVVEVRSSSPNPTAPLSTPQLQSKIHREWLESARSPSSMGRSERTPLTSSAASLSQSGQIPESHGPQEGFSLPGFRHPIRGDQTVRDRSDDRPPPTSSPDRIGSLPSPPKSQPGQFRPPFKKAREVLGSAKQATVVPPPQDASYNIRSELNHIMDFETKKREAIARQRVSTRRNTEERPSNQDVRARPQSPRTVSHTGNGPVVVVSPDAAAFANKFGSTGVPPIPTSERRNPSRNRYLAAIRDLDRPAAEIRNQEVELHTPQKGNAMWKAPHESMGDSDPRLCLIRHRKRLRETESDSSKSADRLRRAKSDRLPFETISPDEELHHLRAMMSHKMPNSDTLQGHCRDLLTDDTYVRTGCIEHVAWADCRASDEVDHLGCILRDLVQAQYRAERNDDNVRVAGQARVDVEIALEESLQRHLEAFNQPRQGGR